MQVNNRLLENINLIKKNFKDIENQTTQEQPQKIIVPSQLSRDTLKVETINDSKITNNLSLIDESILDPKTAQLAISYTQKNIPVPVIEKIQSFFKLPQTGVPDQNFVNKLAQFQKSNNLVVDGKLGPKTMETLIKNGLDTKGLTEGPYPRYDELFKDGLLDVTIGIGFDETKANLFSEAELFEGLRQRGFKEIDTKKASEIYKKAGRDLPTVNENVRFYYNPKITTYNGKDVSSIILVLTPGNDGNKGANIAKPFIEGLDKSDVTLYGGHGRYGTGPDFDQNFITKITFANGTTATYSDYEKLQEDIKNNKELFIRKVFGDNPKIIETLKNASPLEIAKKMVQMGKLEVQGINEGNIPINQVSPHNNEFGGYLIEQGLKNNQNPHITEIPKDDKYRIWGFTGCRTKDYIHAIRNGKAKNSNLSKEKLDLFTTNKVLYWSNTTPNTFAYLDGIMNKESIPSIVKRFENVYSEQKDGLNTNGFEDNPSIKFK